jgi:uncharacterized protein
MKPDLRELLDRYSEDFSDFEGIDLQDVNQAGIDGEERPLHLAARHGLIDDMRILLREGADVDARGDLGLTPLHNAAMKGHIAAVQLLLEHGADVDAKDENGSGASDWGRRHPAVLKMLASKRGTG